MKIKAYILNAFTKSGSGGNAAGVVLAADNLREDEMKKIAAFLGYSETAFVMKSACADFKVRFFTVNDEVDLCGHATVGAYSVLASLGHINPGSYLQETNAGILKIQISNDFSIMMSQQLPAFDSMIDKEEIASSLNIHTREIDEYLPVQIVSTGLRDILIPVKNKNILYSIQPNFEEISTISKKYNAIGYHVFALESHNNIIAQCRNFAPLFGIPEESATGTSNGALGCYLFKYGKVDSNLAKSLIFEQGYTMKKQSEIAVSLSVKDKEIIDVMVGGKTSSISETEIEI